MNSDSYLHELLAQRDELMEQLQGEWPVDKNLKSISRKGARVGLALFFAGMLFSLLVAPVLFFLAYIQGTLGPQASLLEITGMAALFMFALGLLCFVIVHIQAFWYRQFNPIVVEGTRLIWNKKKGHVPEKLNLCTLEQVAAYEGEGNSNNRFFIKLMGRNAVIISKHFLFSKGELNTPRFTPAMFANGEMMIDTLEKLAQVNLEIKNMSEDAVDGSSC